MDHAMYLFVNTTIKMDKGKITGQLGHTVQKLIQNLFLVHSQSKTEESKKFINHYKYWKSNGMAKIVLKAEQDQLEQLQLLPNVVCVRDAGLTQIPPNTLTVVGFLPALKLEMEPITKNYKLL